MKNDIRYSELVFLRALSKGEIPYFSSISKEQTEAVSLYASMYIEMAATLLEELYIRFDNQTKQMFVKRLRAELGPYHTAPSGIPEHLWHDPREAIEQFLNGFQGAVVLRATYRGLRRIEELRDMLRNERILEPFGVLLSMQYFRRDLEDALKGGGDTSVSVLYADMDNFKRINTEFGQQAGDVVMKAYLEAIQNSLGLFGEGYRGVGDEVACIIRGQGHDRAIEMAEKIRQSVKILQCEHKGRKLPLVTASIGVVSAPPESRSMDIEAIAQDRKQLAKDNGKNCVVSK